MVDGSQLLSQHRGLRHVRSPSRSTRLPSYAGGSGGSAAAQHATGLLPHGFRLAAPTTWTEVWPFLAAGVPGINVSTFTAAFDRAEYHTQYDTSDRVDFDYLAGLARSVRALAA